MTQMVLAAFGGENHKRNEYLLRGGEAILARNVDFGTGKLTPTRRPLFSRKAATQAEAIFVLNGSVVELDFAIRGYVTVGGDAPRALIAAGGYAPLCAAFVVEGQQKPALFSLSLPAPAAAPVCSVTGNANAGATDQSQVFAYSLQRVYDGAESPLSPIASITARAGQSVSVNVLAGQAGAFAPADGQAPEVTRDGGGGLKVLLYRAVNSGYLRVGEATYNNAAASSFSVSVADASEGVAAQFVGEETTARADLRGVGIHPKGFAFGFSANRLCFSAVLQYGVWPRSYEIVLPEGNIEAVAEFNGDIYIFPQNAPPRLVRLDSPTTANLPVAAPSNYPIAAGCGGSVVNMGRWGLWYATAEGIASLPSGELFTGRLTRSRGKNAFIPPTMAWRDGDQYFAARADNAMYISMRGGLQAGAPQLGEISEAGISAISAETGGGGGEARWALQNGNIVKWGAGKAATLTWRSGRRRLADKGTITYLWLVAGKAEELRQARRNPTAWWKSPRKPLAGIVESSQGDVRVTLRSEAETDIIRFPQDTPPAEVWDENAGDVVIMTSLKDVTGWLDIEVESEREVLFIGVGDNREGFVGGGAAQGGRGFLPPAGGMA